uniref:DNA-directed DNA polymerase family A palm domain-containing protein n=1 Tax=Maylandia zebra TaxID=106582 RepID=A0A3P9D0I7_9CICH
MRNIVGKEDEVLIADTEHITELGTRQISNICREIQNAVNEAARKERENRDVSALHAKGSAYEMERVVPVRTIEDTTVKSHLNSLDIGDDFVDSGTKRETRGENEENGLEYIVSASEVNTEHSLDTENKATTVEHENPQKISISLGSGLQDVSHCYTEKPQNKGQIGTNTAENDHTQEQPEARSVSLQDNSAENIEKTEVMEASIHPPLSKPCKPKQAACETNPTTSGPKGFQKLVRNSEPPTQSKAGCLAASLTCDPRVKYSGKLKPDEKVQMLEIAGQAKVLVLTMVYQDGSTQLDAEQVRTQNRLCLVLKGKEDEVVTVHPRAMFIPQEGCTFLAADFCQVELRLLAHLSSDPELLRIFTNPQADVFTMLASQWWKEVTSEDREHAKRVVYSVVYGAGRERLSGILGVSSEQASQFQDRFLQTYRDVQGFIQRTIQQSHKQGYVLSIMGRRRNLPNINSPDWAIRMQAERQAVNFVVQGRKTDSTLCVCFSQLLFIFHIRLLFVCCCFVVANALPFHLCDSQVPLKVAVSSGKSWGSMSELDVPPMFPSL